MHICTCVGVNFVILTAPVHSKGHFVGKFHLPLSSSEWLSCHMDFWSQMLRITGQKNLLRHVPGLQIVLQSLKLFSLVETWWLPSESLSLSPSLMLVPGWEKQSYPCTWSGLEKPWSRCCRCTGNFLANQHTGHDCRRWEFPNIHCDLKQERKKKRHMLCIAEFY